MSVTSLVMVSCDIKKQRVLDVTNRVIFHSVRYYPTQDIDSISFFLEAICYRKLRVVSVNFGT